MVDVDKFMNYHTDVHYVIKNRSMGRFGDPDGFCNSMDRLLLNLVQRLPDEEQFMPWTDERNFQNKTFGVFFFGFKEFVTDVWEGLCRGDPTIYLKIEDGNGNTPPPDTVKKMIRTASSSKVREWQQRLEAKDHASQLSVTCHYDLDSPFFVVNILTDMIEENPDIHITAMIAYSLAQMSYQWRERKVMVGLLDSLLTQGYEDSPMGEARRLGFGDEMDELDRLLADPGTITESDPAENKDQSE
jgi:hypothetical protein